MNVSVKALLVASIGAGLAATAHAQAPTANVPTQHAAKPFTVKLGASFPTDGDVKDAVGSTWFNFGLNYDLGKTKTASPLVYGGYLDGTFASRSKDGAKFEASAYGIGPEVKYYFGEPLAPVNFYAGGGLGAYFLHAKAGDSSENTTRFGGKLLAGAEFKEGFLGEINYTWPGNVHGSTLNNFGVQIGYRF